MNQKASDTILYRNTKCCDKDMVSSTMDIKDTYNLKVSVPTTYSYKTKDNTVMKRSFNGLGLNTMFICPDHGGQYPSRAKCYQYKNLLQRIRSLLLEIKAIRKNEATGICELCRRYNTTGKCKRCEILANRCGRRYGGSPSRDDEARHQRYKIWLSKVKQFLYVVLEREVCQHKLYHDKSGGADEFTNLLNELKAPLNIREPCIGHFPSMESLSNLTESKDILEEVLLKLKTEKYYNPTAAASTVGGIPCPSTCKYFSVKKFGKHSEEDDDKVYVDAKMVVDSKALKVKIDAKTLAAENSKADGKAKGDTIRKSDAKFKDDTKSKEVPEAKNAVKGQDDAKFKSDALSKGDAKSKDDTNTIGDAKSKIDAKSKDDTYTKGNAKSKVDAKSKDDTNTKGDTKSEDDAHPKNGGKAKDGAKSQKGQDDNTGQISNAADKDNSNTAEKDKPGTLKSDAESKKGKKEASTALGKSDGKEKSNAEVDNVIAMLIKWNNANREPRQKIAKPEKLPSFPSIEELPTLKVKEPKKVVGDVSESIIECGLRITKPTEMIKGTNIVPIEARTTLDIDDLKPILFKVNPDKTASGSNTKTVTTEITKTKTAETKIESDKSGKGVIRYSLSDRQFIDKGWTLLPTTKIMRRMNIYKMLPANQKFDWFKRHQKRGLILYDSCEKFAEIDENGNGKWYYRNGMLALDYYSSEQINSGHRYVVYSSGEKDACGRVQPLTVLASFDSLGNGVVYDHFGNERLKYNQSEGVVVDSKIGPPGRWKWHTLNDPPVLQPVFINTHAKLDSAMEKFLFSRKEVSKFDASKRVPSLDMLAIELENFMKEKASKLLQEFKPFHIKMKALKINDQFSLKVMDQSNIHLMFRDGQTTAKLDLGMLLLSDEIIDTDTSEMSQVATPYDRHPPKSQSIADIQNILQKARKLGKSHSRLRD